MNRAVRLRRRTSYFPSITKRQWRIRLPASFLHSITVRGIITGRYSIEKIEDELFLELNEILDLSGDTGSSPDPSPVLNNIFEFLYQNQTAIAAFLGPHGDRAFLNKIKELFKERMFSVWEEHSYQAENFEYYNSFIISGCIGMVEFWVQNNFQKSPEEMAQLSTSMILKCMEIFSPQPL